MKKWQKVTIGIILIVIGIATIYLFYNQATGKFLSDLSDHIEAALDDSLEQYTITKPIYKFIFNKLGGNAGIAVFLALIEIMTIFATQKLLKHHYMSKEKDFYIWIWAIVLNFVIAIYIPMIHNMYNVGVQESVEWHNSTFICMKFVGLLAIFLYYEIESQYLEKIDIKKYILFCILLILVNLIKPNFIIAFAPSMLVFLIIDFFKNIKNKKAIINIIIFGCAVLISLPILIYQNKVLYVEDSNSGIVINFMSALKMYHKYPIISIIQSVAFPIFILLTNIKTVFTNRKHSFAFTLSAVGLSEFLLLAETGGREGHCNFDYGYSFAIAIAFISTLTILRERNFDNGIKSKIYLVIAYGLLLLHILSGIVYFSRLLLGYTHY